MSGSSFNSGNGFSPRRPDFNGYLQMVGYY